MLHVFRGHTKKIFWGLVAFVVPAFCLWGLGSSYLDRENNKELGRVQGVTITQRDFQRQLEAVKRAMEIDIAESAGTTEYNRDWVRQYLDSEDINDLVWKRVMLVEVGRRLGFEPGRRAVASWLGGLRMFQTDGVFDFNKYAGYLRGTLRIEPMLFEEEVRENVLTRLAMGALSPLSFISAAEERDFELMRHEQIDLECAVFENAAQSVSREEIKGEDLRRYFAENRTAFFVPVRRKIRFVLMPYAAVLGLPEAGEQELRAYFDANVQLFADPSGTPARFEDRRGAVAQALKLQRQKEAVRESARKLFYRLVQQDSGAEQAVAQAGYEISESAAFSQENPEPLRPVFGADDALVAREAFKAGLQGWSSPLALSGGVVLLMPASEEPAREPSFEEARPEVEKKYLQHLQVLRARERAQKLAESLALDGGAGFREAAASAGAKYVEFPPFSMLAPPVVPRLGEKDVLALFSMPVGKTSSLIALPDGFLVARVRGYKTPPAGDAAALKAASSQASYRKRLVLMEATFQELARNADFPPAR